MSGLRELSELYTANELVVQLEELLGREVSEQWLQDWSTVGQKVNDLYISLDWCYEINMTDQLAENRYNSFLQNDLPRLNNIWSKLAEKSGNWSPSSPRLKRIVDRLRLDAKTSSEKSSNMEKEEQKLAQNFKKTLATRTLEDGETILRARNRLKFIRNIDERFALWLEIENRVFKGSDELDHLFYELVQLRNTKSKVLGFQSYPQFVWAEKRRVDYTPEISLHLIHSINEKFEGAKRKLLELKANKLGISVPVRPWNLDVSFENEPPRQFTEAEYLEITKNAFSEISPKYGSAVEDMIRKQHIDIMNRPKKGTANFVTCLTQTDEPLLLTNCTGALDGFRALFHEFGHAMHHITLGPGKLCFEKSGPKEVNEFIAYTFQIVATQALINSSLVSDSERVALRFGMLNNILEIFETISNFEQFEHWVYTKSNLVKNDFGPQFAKFSSNSLVDWTGFEKFRHRGWQRNSVISSPFYTVEYVIAWIAALTTAKRLNDDPALIRVFEEAMSLGNTRTTRETFEVLDITFPFTEIEILEAKDALDFLYLQWIQ
ncbi:MAG: M3 family metallopeptidase [Trueperaceae bacterium]